MRKKKQTQAKRKKMAEKVREIFKSLENINRQFNSIPSVANIEEAVRMIEKLFLNIVDFCNGNLKKFDDLNALRKYTKNSHKFFPKERVKQLGIQHLLITIC